jgi:hypothetical protein
MHLALSERQHIVISTSYSWMQSYSHTVAATSQHVGSNFAQHDSAAV